MTFRARWLEAVAWLESGDADGFRRTADRLASLAARLKSPLYDWLSELCTIVGAMLRGSADEAMLTETYERAAAAGFGDAFSAYGVELWQLRRDHGGLEELIDLLRAQADAATFVPAWRVAVAASLVDLGRHDEARAEVDRLGGADLRLPLDNVYLAAAANMGELALELDDPALAARVIELLEPYVGRLPVASNVVAFGPVTLYLGHARRAAGDTAGARAAYELARAHCADIGARVWSARVERSLGLLLAADGDPAAGEHLEAARRLAGDLDMPYELARLDAAPPP
jgi:hypothetical protein